MITPASVPIHDIFDWWASIWIPAFVGAASIFVAAAAIIASGRARSIARKSELARIKEEERQRGAAERSRVLEAARDEARLARKWVILSTEFTFASRDIPSEVHPTVAWVEARTALQQSLVPGAADLYMLTKFDVDNIGEYLPGSPAQTRNDLLQLRIGRALERIRLWAEDPDGYADSIREELRRANTDAENYLKIGLGPSQPAVSYGEPIKQHPECLSQMPTDCPRMWATVENPRQSKSG